MTDRDPIDWKTSPIDRRGWTMMATTWAATTIVLVVVGLAIVEWWEGSAAGDRDADLIRWLEDRRTGTLDEVAFAASAFSDTITKIIFGVVLIPLFLWMFRRWHEYALLAGGLLVEVCAYGVSSRIVGRERPPVDRLDGSPGDSFPSGHIAAATVFYVGLAMVIYMRTERPGPRLIARVIAVVVPLAMVGSRLYLGMHYLSDAVFGLALGGVVAAVMWRVVHRTLPDAESPELHDRTTARDHELADAP